MYLLGQKYEMRVAWQTVIEDMALIKNLVATFRLILLIITRDFWVTDKLTLAITVAMLMVQIGMFLFMQIPPTLFVINMC